MNKVLIIGNGFDLYHRLPTRYTDFLFFMNRWEDFKKKYYENPSCSGDIEWIEIRRTDKGELIEESIEDFAKYRGFYNEKDICELDECAQNVWVTYFNEIVKDMPPEKRWVDFEAEIYKALQFVDDYYNSLPEVAGSGQVASIALPAAVTKVVSIFGSKIPGAAVYNLGVIHRSDVEPEKLKNNKDIMVSYMKCELDKLNLSLNLYLWVFVCCIKCNVYSRQIKELSGVNLLNFNYTYTYKEVYGGQKLVQHHPIHGDAKERNMVLGIPDDTFEETLDYIYFQKYFQRILKKTGNYYKEWITRPEMSSLEDAPAEVFIMGHSLSVADKGILKDFFCGKFIEKITIYYHSQKSYEEMVINLVEMFGKSYVIEATSSGFVVFEKLDPPIEGSAR